MSVRGRHRWTSSAGDTRLLPAEPIDLETSRHGCRRRDYTEKGTSLRRPKDSARPDIARTALAFWSLLELAVTTPGTYVTRHLDTLATGDMDTYFSAFFGAP